MIRLENVCVYFGKFQALKNITLEIKKGEFFTLLGPSGCGKTTTLRAITGFIKLSQGKIYIDDKDITDIPVEKRNIGMVFQSYALFPTMTVYENIAFPLKIQKLSKLEIDDKVKEIAKKVDLAEDQLVRNVTELSGGQQQRVAIARALATNPSILCLDEPLSNLDAKLRVQLRNELKDLQRRLGITMIYVTHDQEEALTLSDHICVFKKGEIDQIGTPNEIYHQSKTEYTCNFIGDINSLSNTFVQAIESKTNHHFENKMHHYIRLERLHLNHKNKEMYCFFATVEYVEYYGIYIKYHIKTQSGDLLKVIEKNDGEKIYQSGEQIEIGLYVKDILSFKGEEIC